MNVSVKRFLMTGLVGFGLMGVTQAWAQQPPAQDPRSSGGGSCERNAYNCIDTPNPLPATDTVWLRDMTWMDVRDALAAGKTTIIISTGGIEPNGPWLALGKHYYALRANCEAIARKLKNALCAPIIDFVPAGDYDPPSRYMTTAGTISVRQETYEALLTDTVRSMKVHGFTNIVLIGDNGGGNQTGMKSVADVLNKEWGAPIVHYIPEYYDSWNNADAYLIEKGIAKEGVRDGIHDDPASTLHMIVVDPHTVRWAERVKAGKATINGVSIADKKQAQEWGRALIDLRATITVDAINKAVSAKLKETASRKK